MGKRFDESVLGSDLPRSRKQYLARRAAGILVRLMRLNRPGFMTTEIVQAIEPVATIKTRHGDLFCRCGHGRLLWRAKTFHTEEPQTVEWLDSLRKSDVLWDIGANVGLYSIYAAKFMRCRVIAFEPESQNFALLVENIVLNQVGHLCSPACIAVTGRFGIGRLHVRYLTKGGAYNLFQLPGQESKPASVEALENGGKSVEQFGFGVSLDDLVLQYGMPVPTHLKIDVDGLEPDIIDGARVLLQHENVRSILIEINKNSDRDLLIPQILAKHGFGLISERSNWLSRANRAREHEMPTTNMIFSRIDS